MLNFFECVSIPAVNIFVIITGYFSCLSNNRKIGKPLNLLVQKAVWGIIFAMGYGLCVESSTGLALMKSILGSVIAPNYFVTLFIVLYIVSPYLNLMISSITEKSFRLLIIYYFLIFSVYATLMDLGNELLHTSLFDAGSPVGQRGSQFGYTIVHFMFIYLLGAYIRMFPFKMSIKKSIIGILFSLLFLFCWRCFDLLYLNKPDLSPALSYNNPFVICLTVYIFLFFKQLRINSYVINELAGAAFTCYLIQGYFLKEISISHYVNGSLLGMIIHIIISMVTIYLISYMAFKMFSVTLGRLLSKIDIVIKY